MHSFGKNNDRINLNQFLAGTVNKKKLLTEQNIKIIFDTFDVTGKGYITIDEFRRTGPAVKESEDGERRR